MRGFLSQNIENGPFLILSKDWGKYPKIYILDIVYAFLSNNYIRIVLKRGFMGYKAPLKNVTGHEETSF
jgi:hypothetical protein